MNNIEKKLQELEEEFKNKIADLRKEALEEEPKFKKGDWIYSLNECTPSRQTGDVFKVVKLHEDGESLWYEEYTFGNKKNFRLATHPEIESHLIEEAKKKGFDVGVRIVSSAGLTYTIKKFSLITNNENHTTGSIATSRYFNDNGIHLAVWHDGGGVAPIDTYCLDKDKIAIGNNIVQFTDTGITVGCTSVDKETILKIAKHFQV